MSTVCTTASAILDGGATYPTARNAEREFAGHMQIGGVAQDWRLILTQLIEVQAAAERLQGRILASPAAESTLIGWAAIGCLAAATDLLAHVAAGGAPDASRTYKFARAWLAGATDHLDAIARPAVSAELEVV